ncbi:predicted protein [Sparassis crispa]|uniref:DNA polymerase delta subunit 4 n=1 Tax=Sparassis crispa TaxID=139825 RepID=A0A401GWX9_9APHY|nr:predicted protein [Sparassis crispa]GBE86735.1 predicted protein [Sparassis crispa]
MSPPKSTRSLTPTSSSSIKKLRSSTQQALKQGTLSFADAKRTGSTGSLAKGKPAKGKLAHASSTASKPAKPAAVINVSSDSDVDVDEEEGFDFEEEIEVEEGSGNTIRKSRSESGEPALKRRRTEEPKSVKGGAKVKAVFDSREGEENAGVAKGAKKDKGKAKLDLKDRAGRWRKHYGVVREKMGHLEPVHAEGQTMIDHTLRVFDLSYEYGPCIGVTRLQRWERAEALGLNPPPEVKEILLTKEGSDDERYSECVFYGEV